MKLIFLVASVSFLSFMFITCPSVGLTVPDPPCLLFREDQYRCTYKLPDTTKPPKDNQYGIYTTRIERAPDKLVCKIRNKNHQIKDISIVGDDPLVKFIFSPGNELPTPKKYAKQTYINYKVRCPENHHAYLTMVEFELEEPNCPIDDSNGPVECVDYLWVTPVEINSDHVERKSKTVKKCGTNPGELANYLPHTRGLDILFRSNDRKSFYGFNASVVCYDTFSALGRKKRSIDADNNYFDSKSIKEPAVFKRSAGHHHKCHPAFRYQTLYLEGGDSFEYCNNRLIITQGDKTRAFDSILTLKILNEARIEVASFQTNARDNLDQLTIYGPGILRVVKTTVYYTSQQTVMPSPAEREIISQIARGHFERFDLESPEEELCEAVLEPPPFDPNNIPLTSEPDDESDPECSRPTVTKQITCNWSDSDVRLALANFNAPNVVVRTISRVAVNCTRVFQSGRIEALQLADSISCTVTGSRVRCSDNWDGNLRFTSCSVIGSGGVEKSSLGSICTYPSFELPNTLTPGYKVLNLTVRDSSGNTVNKSLNFFNEFSVNCFYRTVYCTNCHVPTTGHVNCTSNQVASRVRVSSCEVNTSFHRRGIFPQNRVNGAVCQFPGFCFPIRDERNCVLEITFEDLVSGITKTTTVAVTV